MHVCTHTHTHTHTHPSSSLCPHPPPTQTSSWYSHPFNKNSESGQNGEDGFPLIIDNGTFARALELYIQKRWFTILFNNGEIDYRVLQNIQQEYGFAVKTAQSDLVRPSVDQMESITRMWNSLIQKNNKHLDSFNRLNRPDLIK